MKILSISPGHDANYCVFENGKVIVHNELERFTRFKHDYENDKLFELIKEQGDWENRDELVVPINFYGNKLGPPFLYDINKITVGHHTSHAASAYYDSGFENSIIFTMDGGGFEPTCFYTTGAVFVGNKNKINTVYKNFTWDLGHYWISILSILDMGTVWSEQGDQSGTLMAMAAYGDPFKYINHFDDLSHGCAGVWNREKIDSIKRLITNEQSRFDIAASLQYSTEQFMKSFVFSHINCFNSKNICFSGGTMLNCVSLGKIAKTLISLGYNVFCDQAPNDSGLSLGAAKYYYYHELENQLPNEKTNNSYYGRVYSENQVNETLNSYSNLKIDREVELDKIVDLLMGAKIISLFNEGSESGKRALGNRSIVADPRFGFIKDQINARVKHRKSFRPFAPSVLREEVSNWFQVDIESPYMSFAIEVKPEKRKLIQSVIHKDGTSRLQTVTKNNNGYYYDLIKMFFEKTKVPMLLNTSFNDREPIVETPKNAIDCFLKTEIDYLYFVKEKLLVSKI